MTSSALLELQLPFGIRIEVDPECQGARLTGSELRRQLCDDEHDERGQLATDVVESLLLALAAAGVPLDTRAASNAVSVAVESIAQHLP